MTKFGKIIEDYNSIFVKKFGKQRYDLLTDGDLMILKFEGTDIKQEAFDFYHKIDQCEWYTLSRQDKKIFKRLSFLKLEILDYTPDEFFWIMNSLSNYYYQNKKK